MKPYAAFLSVSLAACGPAVDIGPETKALSTAATTLEARAQDQLGAQARREAQESEARLIAAGRPVVTLQGICNPRLEARPDVPKADCRLKPRSDLMDGPVNATQILAALAGLDDYLAALSDLAAASGSAETGRAAGAMVLSLGALAASAGDASGAARLQRLQDPVADLVQRMAAQGKRAALRDATAAADPHIIAISASVEAWEAEQVGWDATLDRLREADSRYRAAQVARDSAAQRQALTELRQVHARYRSQRDQSLSAAVTAIAELHHALPEMLRSGASPDDIAGQINTLVDLAEAWRTES